VPVDAWARAGGYSADHPALARRVPALEDHDDACARVFDPSLQAGKLDLQLRSSFSNSLRLILPDAAVVSDASCFFCLSFAISQCFLATTRATVCRRTNEIAVGRDRPARAGQRDRPLPNNQSPFEEYMRPASSSLRTARYCISKEDCENNLGASWHGQKSEDCGE
jgi:hypothetical protein